MDGEGSDATSQPNPVPDPFRKMFHSENLLIPIVSTCRFILDRTRQFALVIGRNSADQRVHYHMEKSPSAGAARGQCGRRARRRSCN
ncbi:hypothetical protein MTP99_011454 [Tenebrio molitor]|nr:hypothetical protein MTP99_011454 [Tenebrio molitor]